jgi:hypothetical protein
MFAMHKPAAIIHSRQTRLLWLFAACSLLCQACGPQAANAPLSSGHLPVVASMIANPPSTTAGTWVALHCLASDVDGDIAGYAWSGSGEFESPTTAATRWRYSSSGNFTLRCAVTDRRGFTANGALQITVTAPALQHPPVITSLTADRATVEPGANVQLSCTAVDADGGVLNYSWSGPGSFTMPAQSATGWSALNLGVFKLACTVQDATGLSGSQSVTITVAVAPPPNRAPSVTNIGADPPTCDYRDSTQLTCLAFDPDGDLLTYAWQGLGEFDTPALAHTAWRSAAGSPGGYTLSCTVTDSHGSSVAAEIVVDTFATPNEALIAELRAEPDTVFTGQQCLLTCTLQDPSATDVAYGWSGAGMFDQPGSASTPWQAGAPGEYDLACATSDKYAQDDSASVHVTVIPPPDTAPPEWVGGSAGFSVAPYEGYVLCGFSDAVDAESPPVRYTIYYAPYVVDQPLDPGSAQKVELSGAVQRPVRISGLQLGLTYEFGLQATDSAPALNSTPLATTTAMPQVYFDIAPEGDYEFSNWALSGSIASRSADQPILCAAWVAPDTGQLFEAHASDGAWAVRAVAVDGLPARFYTLAKVLFFSGKPIVVAADNTGKLDLLRQRVDGRWDGVEIFAADSGKYHTWLDMALNPDKPQLYIGHITDKPAPPAQQDANFLALNLTAGGNTQLASFTGRETAAYVGQLQVRFGPLGKPAMALVRGQYSLDDPAQLHTELVISTYQQYAKTMTDEVVTAATQPLFADLQPGLDGWNLAAVEARNLTLDGKDYLGARLISLTQAGGMWLPPNLIDNSAPVQPQPPAWQFDIPLECHLAPGEQTLYYVKATASVEPLAEVGACSLGLWSGPLATKEPGAALAQLAVCKAGNRRYLIGIETNTALPSAFARPALFVPGKLLLRQMN